MESRRVIFEKGHQRAFISIVLDGKSLSEFCKEYFSVLKLKYSTFKNYYREINTLPYKTFQDLQDIGNIKLDQTRYKIISKNWWQSEAGKRGIKALFRKYDEETLNQWRGSGVRKSRIGERYLKKVNIPDCVNESIAELVGAYLGDGTLAKYFIRISGDKRFDLPYFNYLANLVKQSFDLAPAIRSEKIRNTLYLEIRSKLVCDYFQKEFGFEIGDKIRNKTKIPEVIFEQEKLLLACLRGLVDTDGSVSKDGKVLSVRLSSHNSDLLNQVKACSQLKDIFTIISNPKEVGTRSIRNIKKYFGIVGSSNIRHIIRYCEYLKGNLLRKPQTLDYYPIYQSTYLPFKS